MSGAASYVASVSADSVCAEEIRTRTNLKLQLANRKRVLRCCIEHVLVYAGETWVVHIYIQQLERRIKATEMWLLKNASRTVDSLKDR